jgi:ABC-type transporter Mla subunit MlaD
MASDARKFQVGLFVLSAAAIGVGAAIWLGASRYLADEILMVTYFSESVQGLDPGSDVKFRGVPGGRVQSIDIAPDQQLIEVTLSVKADLADVIRNDDTLRAQLQLAGITGLRYVEVDHQTGDALRKSPMLNFVAPHETIPSTPSSFAAIQEALEEIYDNVIAVDFPGISADIRATLKSADELLRDDRVHRILSGLAELSESASRVTRNVEKLTKGVEVAPAIEDLRKVTIEARGFLADLRGQDVGGRLRATLDEFGGAARSTQQFLLGLRETIDRLDRSLGNLETLTDDVSRQPSRLIFSNPPEPRREGDGGTR